MFKTLCQQEAVRCNAQGGVMMKATPAPSLVVAQAEFLFKLLIVSFNATAHLGGIDQIYQRGISGHRRQPILGRFCLILWPFDQQPLILTWRAKPLLIPMRSPHSERGKARRQFLVGSLAPDHPVPSACAQRFAHPLHIERCGARHTLPACPGTPDFVLALWGHRPRACCPYRGDRLHPNTILQLHLAQRFTPRRFVAISRIRQHNADGTASGFGRSDLLQRDLGLGLKLQLLWHPAFFRRRRSLAHFSGKYSRQSIGTLPRSVVNDRLTAT